jgi:putative PIN family toxin of toxin-antitoxin system
MRELLEVVQRPKFDRYTSLDVRMRFLESLWREAVWVGITQAIHTCRDPKDDKFLEVAVNGGASCIVTGDADR